MKHIYKLEMRRKNDNLIKFKNNIRVYNKLSRIEKATKDLFPNLKYNR
jgi:hypothetical protein